VYQNKKGETAIWGIKHTDLTNKDKKLCLKEKSLPENYGEHVMYLFKNDYIKVFSKKKDEMKFLGFYKSVENVNQNKLKVALPTKPKRKTPLTVSKSDVFKKYDIDILGNKGGEIKCSAPLSLIPAKK
jgi:CRISPR-associated endonuclease Csn1